MKKKLMVLSVLVFVVMVLSGCKRKIELDSLDNLPEEPDTWKTEDSIYFFQNTTLPDEIQREYINLIQESKEKSVYFEYYSSKKAKCTFSKVLVIKYDVITFLEEAKLFQKNEQCIAVSKVWRTITRRNLDEDTVEIIDIDIPNDKPEYVKIAEARDFTIVYDTNVQQYKCLQYGKVLGSTFADHLDALLYGQIEEDYKTIAYNEKEYFIQINISPEETTFNVVDISKRPNSCNVMDIIIGDNLFQVCLKYN